MGGSQSEGVPIPVPAPLRGTAPCTPTPRSLTQPRAGPSRTCGVPPELVGLPRGLAWPLPRCPGLVTAHGCPPTALPPWDPRPPRAEGPQGDGSEGGGSGAGDPQGGRAAITDLFSGNLGKYVSFGVEKSLVLPLGGFGVWEGCGGAPRPSTGHGRQGLCCLGSFSFMHGICGFAQQLLSLVQPKALAFLPVPRPAGWERTSGRHAA